MYGTLKKRFGQNFLIDKNIQKKIVSLIPKNNSNIIEIGPGDGRLTECIIKTLPNELLLVEIDTDLIPLLNSKFLRYKNIKIINQNILDYDFNEKIDLIISNLPYNISSQILVKILKFNLWPPNLSDIIFMFQKEVAEKILGKFNTSKYGRLSIITNYKLMIFKKFDISPNCFSPRPKVISTVLHLKPNKKRYVKLNNINNSYS